jgi:hypothetical protein
MVSLPWLLRASFPAMPSGRAMIFEAAILQKKTRKKAENRQCNHHLFFGRYL